MHEPPPQVASPNGWEMVGRRFRVELNQRADSCFSVKFGSPLLAGQTADAHVPLAAEPNPARLLGVAVANCLSTSLVFVLCKYGNAPRALRTMAEVEVQRNEEGKIRIPRIDVVIQLGDLWEGLKYARLALDQYLDLCAVTQSVRAGIAVPVRIVDRVGRDFDVMPLCPVESEKAIAEAASGQCATRQLAGRARLYTPAARN